MDRAAFDSPRHALRAATQPAHARIDALFAHGLRSLGDYRKYLRGMQAFVARVESALAQRPASDWHAWRSPTAGPPSPAGILRSPRRLERLP